MSAELVPLAKTPLADGLPDFVNAHQIAVNQTFLDTLAATACMGDVTLDWYRGVKVQPEAQFGGFASDGTAYAVAGGKAAEQPRGKYVLEPESQHPTRRLWCGHYPRDARILVDVPSLQDKLSDKAKLHSTKHWAHALDKEVSHQFRAASREALIKSETAGLEALGGLALGGAVFMLQAGLELAFATPPVSAAEFFICLYASTIIGHTITKAGGEFAFSRWHGAERNGFKETCFSLIPGYHLDRYLGIEALTRTRRIIRPMPGKQIN